MGEGGLGRKLFPTFTNPAQAAAAAKAYAAGKIEAAKTAAIETASMPAGEALMKAGGAAKTVGKFGWAVAGGILSKAWSSAGKIYSNVDFIAIAGIIILILNGINAFTFYGSAMLRLIEVFLAFAFLFMIGIPILKSVVIALGDLVWPTAIISIFIAKSPPSWLFFLKPLVGLLPNFTTAMTSALVIIIIAFTPSLFIIFNRIPVNVSIKSSLFSFAKFAYIVIIVYAMGALLVSSFAMAGIDALKGTADLAAMTPAGRQALANAGKSIINTPQTIVQGVTGFEKQLVVAGTGGEMYAGEIEQTRNKPIGVVLESFKPLYTSYYEKEPITLLANINVATFPEKTISITSSCSADDPKLGSVNAEVTPPHFSVQLTGKTAVQCKFPSGLARGERKINFSADFDFVTNSDIRAYFMDMQRLISLPEGTDPLKDVPERTPVAVSSSGPIDVGIGIENQPIGLMLMSSSESYPVQKLGISLNPHWTNGRISALKNLLIQVPEGIVISDCDSEVVSATLPKEDPNYKDSYTTYRFSDSAIQSINQRINELPGITLSFTCFIFSNNKAAVLKNDKGQAVDLAQKFFFATANYTFSLTNSATLTVKEKPAPAPSPAPVVPA